MLLKRGRNRINSFRSKHHERKERTSYILFSLNLIFCQCNFVTAINFQDVSFSSLSFSSVNSSALWRANDKGAEKDGSFGLNKKRRWGLDMPLKYRFCYSSLSSFNLSLFKFYSSFFRTKTFSIFFAIFVYGGSTQPFPHLPFVSYKF